MTAKDDPTAEELEAMTNWPSYHIAVDARRRTLCGIVPQEVSTYDRVPVAWALRNRDEVCGVCLDRVAGEDL